MKPSFRHQIGRLKQTVLKILVLNTWICICEPNMHASTTVRTPPQLTALAAVTPIRITELGSFLQIDLSSGYSGPLLLRKINMQPIENHPALRTSENFQGCMEQFKISVSANADYTRS